MGSRCRSSWFPAARALRSSLTPKRRAIRRATGHSASPAARWCFRLRRPTRRPCSSTASSCAAASIRWRSGSTSRRPRRRAKASGSRCRAISTFPGRTRGSRSASRRATYRSPRSSRCGRPSSIRRCANGCWSGSPAASSSRVRSRPTRRSRRCAMGARRFPMTGCRFKSSPAEPRCVHSTICRKFATPISSPASRAAAPPSPSAAATSRCHRVGA